MSGPSIANVRWDGKIINCPYGIDYEGGFSTNFHVGMIRTFDELLIAIRNTIQLSDNGIIWNVQFRQPVFCQDGIYYTITPVSNDYQFFLIVEHCRSIGMLEVLQFYAEVQEQQHEADYDENESDNSDQIPEYQEDESSEDDDDDEYWHEGDGDDDDDDDDVNDDQEMLYENPVLPLVHPGPYSEIDFNLMEIDTYSKPGGRTNFDPSKEFAIGMIFPSRDAVATASVEYSMHRHVQF